MTREEAKAMLPIIKAYADGKTIQTKIKTDSTALFEKWIDVVNPDFDSCPGCYRIKSEPKYRPFNDAEECWQEMKKHQPFGWVKYDKMGSMHLITYLYDKRATFDSGCLQSFKIAFQKGYAFVDGEPFGIKEGGEG